MTIFSERADMIAHASSASPLRVRTVDDEPPVRQRIPVRHRASIRFVDVSDIDYMVAEGNYVRLRTGSENHLVRETMATMEQRYRPAGFLRIHRALLVQVDRITGLSPAFHGAYTLRLRDGTRLTSGRTYRDRIRRALSLKR